MVFLETLPGTHVLQGSNLVALKRQSTLLVPALGYIDVSRETQQ